MHPLLGGTILTLVEGVGDYALKKYAIGGAWAFMPFGVSIYVVLAFTLIWLFQHTKFAILNASWDGLSNVFTMIVGSLVFKELYTIREWAGMILVTLGLVLINGSNSK
jgi:multidrug transporter EmrE-like cation transporter